MCSVPLCASCRRGHPFSYAKTSPLHRGLVLTLFKRILLTKDSFLLRRNSSSFGDLVFFVSPKKRKQKKGDCGHRFGFAKLPSLHAVFRAQREIGLAATCGCAASNMQALVSRKTTLRSATPAENECNLTICAKDSAFRFLIDLLWFSGSL